MPGKQHQQLVCYPKVRVSKSWFRQFNNSKAFHNEGTLHLFSLMALYSYANFRSNTRTVNCRKYMEAPGEWICKLSSLPRILRVHSMKQAIELLNHLKAAGFLDYEMIDEDSGTLKYSIPGWQRHCTHLDYNYYSYKGSGFFFFPLSVGRQLLRCSRSNGAIVFSELDAIADIWLHTIVNDGHVAGSEYMPVLHYTDMHGIPLLSYSYLARRWGWSKSRVGRFILRLEEAGIIDRISFSSSHGSIISIRQYREMIFGENAEQLHLQRLGEILGLARRSGVTIEQDDVIIKMQKRVPSGAEESADEKGLRIQVFRGNSSSFFARPVPLIFYSTLDCGKAIMVSCSRKRAPPNGKTPQITEGGTTTNV